MMAEREDPVFSLSVMPDGAFTTDSVMSIAASRQMRIVRVQEVQADTWRPMTKSLCSTGLSREMLLMPSVMLNMVIARAGACWRPPFDDLVQDVAPA